MKKAKFLPAARREFLAEVRYYNEVRPSLGSQFIAAVEAAIIRHYLALHPIQIPFEFF